MFELDYQASAKIRGRTLEKHGQIGDSLKLKTMDAVAMGVHGAFGADIPSTPVTVSAPVLNFSDFDLKLVLDMFESVNINANVLQPYAGTLALSIGRQEDQLIIDACDADATKTVAVNVSGANTNLTVRKLREARKKLGEDEIGFEDDLSWVTHENNLQSLLSETAPGSSDFNNVKALINGTLNYFEGFNFIILGDRTASSAISSNTGGLPITGTNRENYAFARKAVTLAYRMDPSVTLTWIEQNRRWESVGTFSAGCKVSLPKGVVKITCDESKD